VLTRGSQHRYVGPITGIDARLGHANAQHPQDASNEIHEYPL
jgi:hypothetical protein